MRLPALGFLLAASTLAIACGSTGSAATEDDATDSDITAAETAGAFQRWNTTHVEGEVYQLLLRPDKTFFINVKGLYGCGTYAGFSCPSSWSDGYTGDTDIRGTWRATSHGITLQPAGTGRPSDPIPTTLTIDPGAKKARLDGTIVPNRHIFADLDVTALFGAKHSADTDGVVGAWKVTGPTSEDGFQPMLDGTNVYVGGAEPQEHHVDLLPTHEYREFRGTSSTAKPGGNFFIGGAPDGSGGSVLVIDEGFIFYSVPVVSTTATQLNLEVNPAPTRREMVLEKL